MTPEGASASATSKMLQRTSPTISRSGSVSPIQKKCRICFQTDIIKYSPTNSSNGSLQRGKDTGPNTWQRLFEKLTDHVVDPEDDGFISPCACKGSMAWVHKVCLEEWRQKSARRDSFYSCEYCFLPYRFKHTWMATLLNNPFTLGLLTMMTAMVTALTMGLAVKAVMPMKMPLNFANNVGEPVGGVWGIDGVFIPIIPTRARWTTKTIHKETITVEDIKPTKIPSNTSFSTNTASRIKDTTKSKRGATNGDTKSNDYMHSTISYFNIAYWFTGHSIDEHEEERNDFLSAMMDVGSLKLWASTVAILGIFALIRDSTQWSLLVVAMLLVSFVGMHLPLGRAFTFLFPVPAIYGAFRFICWEYEIVEATVDIFIKNFSSELENYQ